MKKISLLLAALCCIFSMSARTLYLVPNANWKIDNARFAINYWSDTDGGWSDMTLVAGESNTYQVTIDDKWLNVIFCRMNPATTENKWENKWNQTEDLTVSDNANLYTVKEDTWDKGGGSWSIYGVTVAVTGVTLSATEVLLYPGTITPLTAQVLPENANNQKIAWASDKPEIVSVVEGVISALAVGEANITVTTDDGNKTATCKVTVSETAAKGITIHFIVPDDWTDVRGYAWDANNQPILGAWPGALITTKDDKGYRVSFPADVTSLNFIINSAAGQTVDIKDIVQDACYEVDAAEDKKDDQGHFAVNTVECITSGVTHSTVQDVKAHKVVENGQVYILRNGVRYNIFGAVVK